MSQHEARDPFNPYAAPEASLAADVVPAVTGGSLEQTLAGNTTWTIDQLVRDSWRLVRGFKGTCWLAFLAYMGVAMLVGFVVQLVAAFTRSMPATQLANYLLSAFVLWPMLAGLVMLGARRAAGAPTRAGMVGDCFSQAGRIAGLSIVQMLLVGFGFLLFIIPGIYLAVSYILALPLLVDRRLGVWESLETSRRVIGTCWFRTFGLLLAMGCSSVFMLLTFGIAAIWLLPLTFIAWGMLYHRLAGYVGDGEQ